MSLNNFPHHGLSALQMVAEQGLLVSAQSSASCWAWGQLTWAIAYGAGNGPPEPRPGSPHGHRDRPKAFRPAPQGLREAGARGERRGLARASPPSWEPERREPVPLGWGGTGQFEEAAAQGAGCSGCVALSQIQVHGTPVGRGTQAPLTTWCSQSARRPNGRCVVQGVDVRRSLPPGKKHRREHNRTAPASSE